MFKREMKGSVTPNFGQVVSMSDSLKTFAKQLHVQAGPPSIPWICHPAAPQAVLHLRCHR